MRMTGRHDLLMLIYSYCHLPWTERVPRLMEHNQRQLFNNSPRDLRIWLRHRPVESVQQQCRHGLHRTRKLVDVSDQLSKYVVDFS